MKSYQDEHPANTRKAYDSGVKLALGSDSGVVPHGKNAREIEWLVKVGISEAEAIKVATTNAADLLGLADQIGRLEPGMDADLIAVSRRPTQGYRGVEICRLCDERWACIQGKEAGNPLNSSKQSRHGIRVRHRLV